MRGDAIKIETNGSKRERRSRKRKRIIRRAVDGKTVRNKMRE